MQITFESLPSLVQTMHEAIVELSKEVKQLRTNQPINEPPIDSKELMARLSISEPTLIRMKKRSDIPFLEVCGQFRYEWPKVVEALSNKSKSRKGGASTK